MLIHFDEESFAKEVIDEKKSAMVDFWATWCGPCKMLAPTIEALSDELEDKITVGKVDVDECRELAIKYGVMSIPTVIFFKNGEEVTRTVGVRGRDELLHIANSL